MKHRYLSLSVLFTLAALILSACSGFSGVVGSGKVVTETREVSGFDGVSVSGGMRLELSQGEPVKLEIEAEDNILPYIESKVEGGVLRVGFRDENRPLSISTRKPIIVHLTLPELKSIRLSGGSRLVCADLQAADLSLDVSGGGQVELTGLKADVFSAEFSGGGKAEVAGEVNTLKLNTSGGNEFSAPDLRINSAEVKISGGGRAKIYVTEELKADLSGGSHLDYYGKPSSINSNTSGGSDVQALGSR